MLATAGASVIKLGRKEEEPRQESKQHVGEARPERMWTLDASPNWCRKVGEWLRNRGGGVRLTSPTPHRVPHLEVPVAWLSEPLPLAPASPAQSFGRSTLLSLHSRPSSCLPLLNGANAFLFFCTCQHTWNLLAAGTSPLLVLEPIRRLSFSLASGRRSMPSRVSLGFLNSGLKPRGVCIQTLGLKSHHHLMPASLHTSRWAAGQVGPWV